MIDPTTTSIILLSLVGLFVFGIALGKADERDKWIKTTKDGSLKRSKGDILYRVARTPILYIKKSYGRFSSPELYKGSECCYVVKQPKSFREKKILPIGSLVQISDQGAVWEVVYWATLSNDKMVLMLKYPEVNNTDASL